MATIRACTRSIWQHIPLRHSCSEQTKSSPVYIAGQELQKGLQGILSSGVSITDKISAASVVVGSLDQYMTATNSKYIPGLEVDGFWLNVKGSSVQIVGQNERGALYGAFEYLSRLAQGNFSDISYISNPSAPIRWTNEWDNLDGSIERGYAGPSIFFKDGYVVDNVTRVAQYARILASIRINGVIITTSTPTRPC